MPQKINKLSRLPLTNDYIFKRVFACEGSEDILKDFLEAILNIDIQKIEVQNPELPKNNKEEKRGILDIKVQLNENTIIDVEMHFIEIPKFIKKNPEVKTKLEQWLWLLAGKEEKIEMAEKENKEVKKALEILDEVSIDPKERERYDSILIAEFLQKENEQRLFEKGKIEGKTEGKLEIAKKLLDKNVPIDEIIEITSLTKDEIENLNTY